MTLTVLSVAYPFAPVSPDTAGGAEQVLCALDRALVEAGHRSIVIACAGSDTAGRLAPVPRVIGDFGDAVRRQAEERHRAAIAAALARWPVDVVHMHGIDFHAYLPQSGPPVLVTLHLPIDWYPPEALRPRRDNVWFNCVSTHQHETAGDVPRLVAPIENGIDVELYDRNPLRRDFALMLSRICPEKGVHLAIEAAKRAGIPLLIGGDVFPYEAHRQYFRDEVLPRLDGLRRYLGPIGLARKRRLLAAARCVLVPSLAAETSCLVAREAAAAGTAVVAFSRGALVDTVEHGRTGFLVDGVEEMASAIAAISDISRETCRQVAQRRFRVERMAERYFATYEQLAGVRSAAARGAA
jgi:glycosyltransferase involved in cell wall biosynthesis